MKTWLAAALAATLAACATPSAGRGEPVAIAATEAGWKAELSDVVAWVASQKSTGFIIIDDNRIVTSNIWPVPEADTTFKASLVHGVTPDGQTLEDVASQQKSFVALLVGIAIDKGQLDIAKPVNAYTAAGWSKTSAEQEAVITVRNLLEMNSGLAENLSFDAAPDTKFYYNTPAYAILKRVLEGASKQSLDQITQDWLATPAGMTNTAWRKRPAALADVGNPTGLVTTPRDVARMGQLVLDGGITTNGTRVISKAQLDALFVRTKTNPAYGHLWWLNGSAETVNVGPNSPSRAGQFIRTAPADLVAAMGAQDRKLYIIPSRKLVIVRTGQTAPDRQFDEHLWEKLTAVMPTR
ncbi:MAG TPA: serine hydrolase domain-containing protein [Hyphomonadaceae bacterium]|nr:serine hydrolase domain-containing protein [Hyphomonadaceae bacterium]HPN04168.1 serine hydrolase domain-containing protein [Hyphomonadaceae bacterium]